MAPVQKDRDPIKHFVETSMTVSTGLSAKELKEFEKKERVKDYKPKIN